MLTQLQKKKEEGFTIIEVMIVLAIAGLIILVVLLAVPALQRNSRNTTIKNDAAAVAGAINEFTGANNGKLPTTVEADIDTGVVTVSGGANTTSVQGKVKIGTQVDTATTTLSQGKEHRGKIRVVIKRQCNTDANDFDTTVANRSVAVLYNSETTNGTARSCIDA